MMVKPPDVGFGGDPVGTDRSVAEAQDDDLDAIDGLTGVGQNKEIAAAAFRNQAPGGAVSTQGAPGGADPANDDDSRRETPLGSLDVSPCAMRTTSNEPQGVDDDESAAMLMLLGELGGAGGEDESEEEDGGEEEDERGGRVSSGAGKAHPGKGKGGYDSGKGKCKKPSNTANGGVGGHTTIADPNGDPAAGSGPVGEWLKAEGEARMKMADHRRLIYRWTNAIYRLLGMKIPRGMGSLFDKGEKNKREKFDRFLSYYYGVETFEPGTYWYNNADTIQFFIELVRVATSDRYAPEPATIQKLFRKKDPTRQASTWIMVKEELEKTDVSADELRGLFNGEPRVVKGFPRGRPLFVPIPKNPKGHHKYTRGDGGGVSHGGGHPGPSPGGTAGGGKGNTGKGGGGGRGGAGKKNGTSVGRLGVRDGRDVSNGFAGHDAREGNGHVLGGTGGMGSGQVSRAGAFGAHPGALAGHNPHLSNPPGFSAAASRAALLARFGLTEQQLASLGALSGLGTPGGFGVAGGGSVGVGGGQHQHQLGNHGTSMIHTHDPVTAAAVRAAHRHAVVTGAIVSAVGFVFGQSGGVAQRDATAAALAQAAAAASAPGACDRVTLAPPLFGRDGTRTGVFGGGASGSPYRDRDGTGKQSGGVRQTLGSSLKRAAAGGARVGGECGANRGTPVRRLDTSSTEVHNHSTPTTQQAPLSVPPTRLVGDVLMGALGDVLGGLFGRSISFDDEATATDGFEDDMNDMKSDDTKSDDTKTDDTKNTKTDATKMTDATKTDAQPQPRNQPVTPTTAARRGRERLMNLGDEVHKVLPVVHYVESDSGGRGTREPTVDRTALGAEVDSVLVAAHAAESAWRRHRDASRKANELEVSLLGLRNLAEAAACDLQGARIALQSWCDGESGSGNGASGLGLEPSVRALLHGHIGERVASAERKALEAERKRSDAETEASDARAALATAQRAHKPTYEEVRKRALRIRLAAEERCERQIARAASRAERDVDVKKKKLKKERGVAGDTGGGDVKTEAALPSWTDAKASLDAAEAALAVIHKALEGCKTATEWSRVEISKISSGRDV